MKKIISSKGFNLLLLLPFLLSSVKIEAVSIIEVEGSDTYQYVLAGPRQDIFILPNGDSLLLKTGEIFILHEIDSVTMVSPVLDMFMLRDQADREKFSHGMRKTKTAERQVSLKMRSPVFKKEQFVLASLPLFKTNKKYFDAMKCVGEQVDFVLGQFSSFPKEVKDLYKYRRGHPRLRPFLSYLAYSLGGGSNEKVGTLAAAISETTNLHLYCQNDLLDGKNKAVDVDGLPGLIIGGQFFSNLSSRLVCALDTSAEIKVEIIDRLATEIDHVCQGQLLDSGVICTDVRCNEDDFIAGYIERCRLLSGSMYGFSVWSGLRLVSDVNFSEVGYKVGESIGILLQIVNDIADFSILKHNSLSDFFSKKLTAPIYYLGAINGDFYSHEEIRQLFITNGSFEKCLEIVKQQASNARQSISKFSSFTESLEIEYLEKVLRIADSNKYFSNLLQT